MTQNFFPVQILRWFRGLSFTKDIFLAYPTPLKKSEPIFRNLKILVIYGSRFHYKEIFFRTRCLIGLVLAFTKVSRFDELLLTQVSDLYSEDFWKIGPISSKVAVFSSFQQFFSFSGETVNGRAWRGHYKLLNKIFRAVLSSKNNPPP